MAEAAFEERIMHKLESMEKNIHQIKEYLEDSRLNEDEKALLNESLATEEKKLSASELKKKLGV